jgi:4-amino-4-deoxy-L-arabinose transferase-like glycosyltransferase
MLAFVVYAFAVWYAAARWRRRWPSFAWVALGLVGLLLIAYLHYWLNIWTHGAIYLPVLRSILYPYTILVVIVGVYIACLPRTRPGETSCTSCKYDLAGLTMPAVCPECGTRNAAIRARVARSDPAAGPDTADPRWTGAAAPSSWFRSSDQ